MKSYALDHLADPILLHEFRVLLAREAETTADLLARLAEIDARKLYLPAGYPSMFEYCVGEFRLPRQVALKRIRVARTARRFPGIFPALADGRLNPSAVILLAPYLTEQTSEELLAAAANKTNDEIDQLLAERFPRTGVLAWVETPAAQPVPTGFGDPVVEPADGGTNGAQVSARTLG